MPLVKLLSLMSVFKSVRVWSKVFAKVLAGLFFVCVAVERVINGGGTPGPWPTVLYALCGSGLIFYGVRSSRKLLNSKYR
jgi:hypothetical protein